MFFNTKTNEISEECPLNGYLPDGSLVQGLNILDSTIQKLCGILLVKSDTPQPANSYEDISQRQIVIDDDGVNITRVWVINKSNITISPRQMRLWLVRNGFPLSSVDSAIDGIQDEFIRETTKIEWEYSPYIDINHPMIPALAQSLGINTEDIDRIFAEASLI